MKKSNFDIKYTFLGHFILLMIFVTTLHVDETYGLERILATYIMLLFISYGITKKWKTSFFLTTLITLFLGLIDSEGPFNDYKIAYNKYLSSKSTFSYIDNVGNRFEKHASPFYKENFELKPAGEGTEGTINSYSLAKTENEDNINITDKELDKILEKDEKQNIDENEHLKKAGGGLDQLKDLLDMAKKESPYMNNDNDDSEKDTKEYTPAQAQRATYHLIDTVKQLKSTMSEMMPLMHVGKNLINLRKQMGDGNLLDNN